MFERETILFLVELLVRGVAVIALALAYQFIRKYNLERWVLIAVKAAEKLFSEPGMGETKKAWVVDFLDNRIKHLSAEEIDALIEAAVQEIDVRKEKIRIDLGIVPLPDVTEEAETVEE